QNRVARRVRIFRQDLILLPLRGGAKFSVICANLTSDLLVQQAKRIVRRLRPTGTLILAGILKIQFVEVHRTYAATGLKLIATRQDKEWHSAAFAFPRGARGSFDEFHSHLGKPPALPEDSPSSRIPGMVRYAGW